ncbi:MAG TPA: hypothetical protein V6D23_14675 [Candidatus Obscuribacterales bacterium]
MNQRLSLTILSGLLGLTLLTAWPQAQAEVPTPPCEKFEDCLRQTLKSTVPLERALYASQGIQLWTKSIPQRDLYNLMMLRADALIQMNLATANDSLLDQAANDYSHMLELRAGDYLPQTGLARIAELRGQFPQAEQYFAAAIQTGDFLAYLERADYWLRRQDAAQSLADLESALKIVAELQARERDIHPQHLIHLHQLRARTLQAMQRGDEAIVDIRAACSVGDKAACKQARRYERWAFF